MADQFFWIFFATILITRIFLLLDPTPSPTIGAFKWHHHAYHKFRTHHWMLGLILALIALLVHSLIAYAIGLGLFIDELTYVLMGGKTHKDNYSAMSLVGTLAFVLIVYFSRMIIIFPILR